MDFAKYHKIDNLFFFNPETKQYELDKYSRKEYHSLANNHWIATEKIDGTNIRIYWDGYEVHWGGRTHKSVFTAEQTSFMESMLVGFESLFEQMVGSKEMYLFCELIGDKIQGDYYHLGTGNYMLVCYDIRIGETWINKYIAIDIAKYFSIQFTRVEKFDCLDDIVEEVASGQVTSMIEGKDGYHAPIEGLVATPEDGFLARTGERIICKIKGRELKNGQ